MVSSLPLWGGVVEGGYGVFGLVRLIWMLTGISKDSEEMNAAYFSILLGFIRNGSTAIIEISMCCADIFVLGILHIRTEMDTGFLLVNLNF